MQNKKPPFTITEKILTDVMEICELVGKVSSTQHLSSDPVLRRQNRIKTIYSSLAIEQNTLSLEQVTAVLSGKRVSEILLIPGNIIIQKVSGMKFTTI